MRSTVRTARVSQTVQKGSTCTRWGGARAPVQPGQERYRYRQYRNKVGLDEHRTPLDWRTSMVTSELSYTQLVAQVLQSSEQPLTVDEILARVAAVRPVETRNPTSTVRNAMNSERRIVTLGGRPAHYTWWPHHLVDNAFRQPLHASDLGPWCWQRRYALLCGPTFSAARRGAKGR